MIKLVVTDNGRTNKLLYLCLAFNLLLWWRDLLDHDTCHRIPTGSCVSCFKSSTISNMKSNPDGSPGYPLAVTSNLSCPMQVVIFTAVVSVSVGDSINGKWLATFDIVEGEIPAHTATQAVRYSIIAVELDFQSCIVSMLDKDTLLKNKNRQID